MHSYKIMLYVYRLKIKWWSCYIHRLIKCSSHLNYIINIALESSVFHNKIHDLRDLTEIYFLTVWKLEVWYQSAIIVRFWWEHFSWHADGYFLTLSMHGWERVPTLKCLFLSGKVKVAQLCPTLCNPMDYTVHEILQARILEVGSLSLLQRIFPSQRSNPGFPIAGRFFSSWATKEAQEYWSR